MKLTKIKNASMYKVKAPNQDKAAETKGTVERNGDLRAAKTGGTKAKGAL